MLINPVRSLTWLGGNGRKHRFCFTEDPTSFNKLLRRVTRPRQHSLPLKSFRMWFKLRTPRRKAGQNKLSWASPPPPPPDCWKAPSGGRRGSLQMAEVLLCQSCRKAEQTAAFVHHKAARWEHYLQVLWKPKVMKGSRSPPQSKNMQPHLGLLHLCIFYSKNPGGSARRAELV